MLVFVAHNGKTLELQVQPGTRVELVQRALAKQTGISATEQILMFNGIVLDSNKVLQAYSLPAEAGKAGDVFLYNKLHLMGALQPVLEPLPSFSMHVPPQEYQPHTLDAAHSPLIRALPEYERQFRHHLAHSQAALESCQARHRTCTQLVGEIEVQGRAIDAARTNVERHFNHMHDAYLKFMQRYTTQHAKHKALLARFPADMATLSSVTIHPAASTAELQTLADLVPQEGLQSWAASCKNAMQSLAAKVEEGDALWMGLKQDVEALLLQAPTVALDLLARELTHHQTAISDQAALVQVLHKDLAQIERLITSAVADLAGAREQGDGATPLDKCQLMDTMNDNHITTLMPRVEASSASLAALCGRCIDDKNQMTRDVVGQLQRIAGQQSKIRTLRNRLAAHDAALSKEARVLCRAGAGHPRPRRLQAVPGRVHAQGGPLRIVYTGRATALAESIGKLRTKEVRKREAFAKGVQGLMPPSLLVGLGLEAQPPHCQITMAAPAAPSRLPHITLEDLKRVPLPGQDVSQAPAAAGRGQSSAARAGADPAASMHASAPEGQQAEHEGQEGAARRLARWLWGG
ncbi:hypothetical protein WJX73_002901 [Symbiochloris irregularis]|uniref:Ubiquitin-like domain-containing protein n=1 Tax=Symbiochloris irregularis TaxID=706552 RepID=A0AAW1NMI7_9CHLO